MKNPNYSTNERAEAVMGKRRTDVTPFDFPCELDYHCPICEYDTTSEDGNYDERLHWSEYNSFIWCSVCNKDYPSALCIQGDIDRAIKIFLDSVESAIKRVSQL